jgi:hypothetical protein
MTILAADTWRTNAELMLACRDLGYLRDDWWTLDPTYGGGKWWTLWKPDLLTSPSGHDFCKLAYPNNTFDAAVFDPPYVSTGGRRTSTIVDFNQRYGLVDAPRTPLDLHTQNAKGLAELYRVVKPSAYVLVKCMNYISSGKFQPGVHWMCLSAWTIGFTQVDEFQHIGRPRPQPTRPKQVHARNNYSTLLVFQKPKEKR